MKPNTHPEYHEVIFFDSSCDFKFLTRSTVETKGKEKMQWTDGKEYPMIRIEVSSESHPFYTGKHKIMDTAGRIDKFKQRYTRSAEKPAVVAPVPAPKAKAKASASKEK
ncbi:MAG: type B 50S ribosomal protein L31 [Burkholderiales bacterium]|nr:type B 50S ribosomal protein L31 [Burkholderiales bacterium]